VSDEVEEIICIVPATIDITIVVRIGEIGDSEGVEYAQA